MKNYNEMKKFVKNSNGIITYSAMIENGISKYYITKIVKDNIIKKYSRGIYVRNDIFEDDFYILQQKNSKIIFSFNTALYFLNETERTPDKIDITVYKGYNAHRLSKNLRIHYVTKQNWDLGVIEVETIYGFKVKTYNLERTLCDIIRSNNTGIDKEQTNKFIQKMIMKNKVNSIVLMDYAKKLNCEKKIKEIIDILI